MRDPKIYLGRYVSATLLLAITALPCISQIQQLSTDRTGSVLYFATTLNLSGQTAEPHSKIFRWTAVRGVSPYIVLHRVAESRPGRPVDETNFFEVDYPSVTSDGSRLAFVGHERCRGCIQALRYPRYAQLSVQSLGQTIFQANANEGTSLTKGEIAKSGLFLMTQINEEGRAFEVNTIDEAMVRRAGAGYNIDKPFASQGTRQMMTNDGKNVYTDDTNQLKIATGSGERISLTATLAAMAPLINAAGTKVAYESLTKDGFPRQFYALDIATNAETLLYVDSELEYWGGPPPHFPVFDLIIFSRYPYSPPPVPLFGASISDDGSVVLLLTRDNPVLPRQWLFLAPTDGSPGKWFAYAPEGYREAILSGDGQIVFAVTLSGRLLRIDANSEAVTELLPRTPYIQSVLGAGYPGAMNRILGGGFSETVILPVSYPAPTELAGIHVELAGKPMPILKVSPHEIVYQIPWEFPEAADGPDVLPSFVDLYGDSHPLSVTVPSASPFKLAPVARPISFELAPTRLVFETPGPLHENGEQVSLFNPAKFGEALTVFITGLQLPRGTTGVPAPEDGLSAPAPNCTTANLVPQILSFKTPPGQVGIAELVFRISPEVDLLNAYWVDLACSAPFARGTSIGAIPIPMDLSSR